MSVHLRETAQPEIGSRPILCRGAKEVLEESQAVAGRRPDADGS